MMSNLTRIRHSRETRKPAKKNSSLFVKRVAQHCFCTHTRTRVQNKYSFSSFLLSFRSSVSFVLFVICCEYISILVVRGTAKDAKKQHT